MSEPRRGADSRTRSECDCYCRRCEGHAFGEPWQIGTASFWAQQAREFQRLPNAHRLGSNLREELAVCMLGGYGIPGPVGNAAFEALRAAGLFDTPLNEDEAATAMTAVLSQPLDVGGGRTVRYRFHQQRPKRLAAALALLNTWSPTINDLTDVALRDRLMLLPGVGPKTASWVVRNHRDSAAVAIIDIHIHRAGLAAGVFCSTWALPRDYRLFEDAFLGWAAEGRVSAGDLDAVIWQLMAKLGGRGRWLVAAS